MLLVLFVLGAMSAIGGWYLARGRARTSPAPGAQVQAELRQRLQSIASEVGDTLTAEPALEMPSGRVTLYASKARESFVIDTAEFVASIPSPFQMTVVRVEDGRNIVSSQGMIALKSAEPQDQETHLFFASGEAFGRRCMGRRLSMRSARWAGE